MSKIPVTYKRTDFQSDQEVKWCPGCGDYTILASVQNFMTELGISKEKIVFVSGIGCAARFPYYMNTYGLHSIHGRAPAVATGVSVSNPDLSVWVVSGDGDALSIGGNHLVHALRKNINVKILMFNNQIYGLTKGQYSPTSEEGKKTKSSPFGSVEMPLNPMSIALGSEASFVARSIDMDRDLTASVLREAATHKGSAFIEIYQNCNVFNDKAFEQLTSKEGKIANRINLVHGQKTVFGANDEKAVVIRNGEAIIVDTKDVDASEIYVHDIYKQNPSVAFSLSRLSHGPYGPTPVGVFRKVQRDSFNEDVHQQIAAAKEQKGNGSVEQLIRSLGTWNVS
ncbi:MAG: 2-oxoacid:ferredoxin oxidoreductase subunit beta [Actinomycetota bacterium]|nr:2-oxoacid:ferredoxin oxidoreductase subunit beta [Actinomycetota bacterium]MDA3013551.1 2-oxoacid:ferredoxin oxidoreductase subunit beta [Actinomycetota bacterium]